MLGIPVNKHTTRSDLPMCHTMFMFSILESSTGTEGESTCLQPLNCRNDANCWCEDAISHDESDAKDDSQHQNDLGRLGLNKSLAPVLCHTAEMRAWITGAVSAPRHPSIRG